MVEGLVAGIEGAGREVRLVVLVTNSQFVGKQASFELEQRFEVKGSRPVHMSRPLAKRGFLLRMGRQEIELPDLPRDAWAYHGKRINIGLVGKLAVRSDSFADTKMEFQSRREGALPRRAPDMHAELEREDEFKFFASLRAIAPGARTTVLALLLLALPAIGAILFVGVHDQFAAESQAWFFDHDTAGMGQSPLAKGIYGSLVLVSLALFVVRRQLRRFSTFDAALPDGGLARDGSCKASDLMWGVPRLALEGATVRLVAYNVEHGQRCVTNWGDQVEVSNKVEDFAVRSRSVLLYERDLPCVPEDGHIENFLGGEVRFEQIYSTLFPPNMVGGSHGLTIELEAQLVHPDFVDLRVRLPRVGLDLDAFYETPIESRT